jgi:signal transduction histidine kinase
LKVIEKTNKDVLYKEKISIYNYKNEEIYTNNDTVKVVVTRKFLNDVRLEGTATTTYQDIQILGIPYYDKYNRLLVLAGGVDQQGLETLRDLQRILISLYIIIVFTSAIFGWIFAGRALLPIAEVINEMNDIYPNNLKKRLKVRNVKDEIGQLTFTFNNLLTRVEEAFQHQQVFISNVSHELKNPLTKIISQLTVSLLNRRTEEEYQETMESVLQDVKDLNLLTNTLLELTKLSDDSLPNRFTSIRIDDIIWEARSSLLKVHKNYGISIEFSENIDSDEQLSILGNGQLLKVAFMNLIENGCKFSNNQTINVNIGFDKGLFLEFINKGAVIDTKDQKLIFLPFFRSKKLQIREVMGLDCLG